MLNENRMSEANKREMKDLDERIQALKDNPLLRYSTTQLKAELRRRKL